MRIITNKPDPSGFEAGYSLEANSVSHGGIGYVAEGFVNMPLSDNAAIRLVGWKEHDAGYIDNVPGTRTFPSWDADSSGNGTIDNAGFVRKTLQRRRNHRGAPRAEGRPQRELDHHPDHHGPAGDRQWHLRLRSGGRRPGRDPLLSRTGRYDRWWQAALTVEGKIGNFDLTYAFAHLKRDDEVDSDYSDYSFWYDTLNGSGAYFYDNNGALVDPSQYIIGLDAYKKTSHELRICPRRRTTACASSPACSCRSSRTTSSRTTRSTGSPTASPSPATRTPSG